MDADLGFGFGGLETSAVRQVVHEDLMIVKAKAPNSKQAQKRRTTTSTLATTIFPLNMPLGNGSGLTFPSREEPQGPLSVDNDLELDADFLLDMVAIMQVGIARKARRMVIE
ncbi:unnamed protein product [Sphagnum jensenii]|uniref:Uncharacterized protein n=1 Tax=Sphagnum jensenii TaxID=128206 RepID=A0ABP1BPI1_9BRYO